MERPVRSRRGRISRRSMSLWTAGSGRFVTAEACAGVYSVVSIHLFYPKGDRISSPDGFDFSARICCFRPFFAMGKIRGTSCMRSHISVHPATTKYFSNSFIFKTKIEKEGLPKGSPAGLGAGGLEFKSPRPDQYLQRVVDRGPEKSGFSATAAMCVVGAGCAQLLRRSLHFSLQPIREATRTVGLLGDISKATPCIILRRRFTAGVSPLTIAHLMGHSSTQIVPRYAQVLDQNRLDAMKKLESLRQSSLPDSATAVSATRQDVKTTN
jgi:hypothetical protein